MESRTDTTTRTPAWWTDKHTTAWDHVKGALERDWEQSKADLSRNGGRKLNQTVGDTLKQSTGSEPIPPLDMKTRPTDPKAATKEEEKARKSMDKESEKSAKTVSKAQEDIAKEHNKLSEKVGDLREGLATQHGKASDKIADAQDTAAENIAKDRSKIDEAGARQDEAVAKWRDAEKDVRYGFSVRSQYPANYSWDDKLEGKLRGEWEALDTDQSWSASRTSIRQGWDYAGRKL